MNQKEIAEIKRRLNPEKRNATVIRGCYVRYDGSVISTFEQSVGLLSDEETEQYMALFKKVLSGRPDQTLVPIDFSTEEIHSEPMTAMMDALSTELTDPDSVQPLFDSMIAYVQGLPKAHSQSVNDAQVMDNYLLLMMHDAYDVPSFSRNDEYDAEGSVNVFHYLLGCVCPVKSEKSALTYNYVDGVFHSAISSQKVCVPQAGFMYPAYEEGGANLYRAMCYTKDTTPQNRAFIPALFGIELFMSSDDQRSAFEAVLQETLQEDCTLQTVQAVHETMRGIIEEQKKEKTAEAATLTAPEARRVLENCGVQEEKAASFEQQYREAFGDHAQVPVNNLIQPKKFTVDVPNISIHVSPDHSDMIQTRWIEGRAYLTIPVEGDVEVNGIRVRQQVPAQEDNE